VGLLDRLSALDDRLWVKQQAWMRMARLVFYGTGVVALLLVLLGVAVSLTELGLALVAGVAAVVLAACASGWVGRRRLAKPRS